MVQKKSSHSLLQLLFFIAIFCICTPGLEGLVCECNCKINSKEMFTKGTSSEKDLIAFINEKIENVVKNEWSLYYPVTCDIIKKFNLKIGAEIGVAFGTHSEFILKNTNVEKLICVDPFKEYWELTDLKQAHWDLIFAYVIHLLEPFKQRAELLRMTSQEAAQIIHDNSLDFVFIDGDHSYENVKLDLDLWFKKIRPGGILVGDDYQQTWGVRPAVNEFCKIKKLVLNIIPVPGIVYERYWFIQK